MAVSSDTCRSLNSPFVSMLLKIAEPSGLISHKSFEMTIPQFQVDIVTVDHIAYICIERCPCHCDLCTQCIHSPFQYDFVTNSGMVVMSINNNKMSLQNFHKQFKEMAAVLETV